MPRRGVPHAAAVTGKRLQLVFMVIPPRGLVTLATFLPNDLERLVVVLDNLGDEFQEFSAGLFQDLAPGGSTAVVPAPLAPNDLLVAAQIAELLQLMEGRVERTLAEAITVANELFGDLGTVGRLLGGVI